MIHAGDLALRGNVYHQLSALKWFAKQPHPCKILVGGNHDHAMDADCCTTARERDNFHEVKQVLDHHTSQGSFVYLEHETSTVDVKGRTIKVFGSPYTLVHGFGAWRYAHGEDIWSSAIEDGTDLVVVHGPPHGMLDGNKRGQACGCRHLANRLQAVQPSLVICGHIHEAAGMMSAPWESGKQTTIANVAIGFPGQFPDRNSAAVILM